MKLRSAWSMLILALLVVGATLVPALAGGDVHDRTGDETVMVGTPQKPRTPRAVPSVPAVPQVAPTSTPPVDVVPTAPRGLGFNPVQRATDHCLALADQFDGPLRGTFVGLGQVAGEMVEMTVTNVSSSPVTLSFVPGMVLDAPADSAVQPIMTEEKFKVTLAPGEQLKRPLVCYCLDYAKDPPPKGKTIAFVWSRNPERFADAMKVLYAALHLEAQSKFRPMLPPLQHRRVVIQRAIWAVTNDKKLVTEQDRSKLKKQIKDDAARAGKSLATTQVDQLTNTIWKDVNQTVEQAKNL